MTSFRVVMAMVCAVTLTNCATADQNSSNQAPSASMGDTAMPSQGNQMASAGGPLASLDTDGDGSVSFAEVRAARNARFDTLDKNNDGALSPDEAAGGLSPFGTGGGQGRMGGQYAFLAADADFDGALTRSEFVEAVIPVLARIDSNMDSRLTGDEFAAAAEQLQARRAQPAE